MSFQLALCARVIRARAPAMEAVLKFGITSEDFTLLEAKNLWSLILSYYTQAKTQGSVLAEETLKGWFKGLMLHDDMPGSTVETLCYQVRRERLIVAGNSAIVQFSQEVNIPTADPETSLATLHKAVSDIMVLGCSTRANQDNAADLAAPLPQQHWVIKELGMQPGAPCLAIGYNASQKSFVLQDLALTLARPEDRLVWGKFSRARRCRVLHLDYEQDKYETRRRYQQLARGQCIDLNSPDMQDHLAVRYFEKQLSAEHRAYFEECGRNFDVIIIDSFAAARGANVEENSAEARVPLDMLTAVSAATGCTFLVIHHAPKGKKEDSREIARGSSAIGDAAGNMLCFVRDLEKDEVAVTHAKNRGGPTSPVFALRVTDTADGGTTITATDAGPSGQAEVKKLVGAIIQYLELHGHRWSGSVAALKRELNVSNRKHAVLQQALANLRQTGRLSTANVGGSQKTTYILVAEAVPAHGDTLTKPTSPPLKAVPAMPLVNSAANTLGSVRLSRCPEVVPGLLEEVVPIPPPLGGGTTSETREAQEEDQGRSQEIEVILQMDDYEPTLEEQLRTEAAIARNWSRGSRAA